MIDNKDIVDLIDELHFKSIEELTGVGVYNEFNPDNDQEVLLKNDGYVEVRGNQLYIIGPREDGDYPTIIPNPNLNIFINGKRIVEEIAVSSSDEIKVFKKNKAKPYVISISDDKLTVYLKVNKELYTKYKLKDKRRSKRFMFELAVYNEPCDIEEVSSKILEDILRLGVKTSIDTSAIYHELLEPTFEQIKVAEGLPVIPAIDSVLEKYFSTEIKEILEEVEGKIDFKNRVKIPHVKVGQVIAKLHPPKKGKEGYTVHGKTLRPKPPKQIEIKPKSRVKITENGDIVALNSGRPTVTGQLVKQIDILKTYEVLGDVDMKTGNIYFHGDIIIRGDVKDNMKVEGIGDIIILGNVYHANIIATQDIIIKGTVISSEIISGQLSLFYSDLYKNSQSLAVQFEQVIEAMHQLEKSSKEKNITFQFGETLSMLIKLKFQSVVSDVGEVFKILDKIPKEQIDAKLRIILRTLNTFKTYQSIKNVSTFEALASVIFSLKDLIAEIESMMKDSSSIHLNSANQSTLKSNGEIVIKKEGVVQSTLFAGTNIIFADANAKVRGGKLEAVKSLKAGIVGTENGATTEIYVGENVEVNKLYNIHLQMPHYSKYFDCIENGAKVTYNKELKRVEFS